MTTANTTQSLAQNTVAFIYSLICYFASLLSLTYFVLFSSGIYAPVSINTQNNEQTLLPALAFNILLIALFGLQHSVMARRPFKAWLATFLPASAERATFCLGSAISLAIIAYFWLPMGGSIWQISAQVPSIAVQMIGFGGWLLLVIATFQLDHFELFGLKQTYLPLVGKSMPDPAFKTPGLYKVVRHPIQLGVLLGIWAVPESTVNHLVLALGMSFYILLGLYFEEKDLVRDFGEAYRDYKKRVAKLLPFLA